MNCETVPRDRKRNFYLDSQMAKKLSVLKPQGLTNL